MYAFGSRGKLGASADGRCRARRIVEHDGYDFIVVGAGSAGCAVAGRLATESSASVLLIEAGGSDRRFTIRVPLMGPMQYGTSLDSAYETEPEPGCADRRIAQPRGRVLGGCSAMNGMFWVKGSNLDYDGWRLPRVADASALPEIPRANTNAPSIMIGERCADFLSLMS